MLRRVLSELERPQTLAQVAVRVGVEPGALWGMLETLQQGGYVGLAYSESPACNVACGGCALRNLCPAADSETPPPTPVWRLTPKGRRALEQGL
ncbi:hypothetical protein [Oceanithermus profundus]